MASAGNLHYINSVLIIGCVHHEIKPYLYIAVVVCRDKRHTDWEKVTGLASYAELHASSPVIGVNDWERPLQNVPSAVMAILAFHISNHRGSHTRPKPMKTHQDMDTEQVLETHMFNGTVSKVSTICIKASRLTAGELQRQHPWVQGPSAAAHTQCWHHTHWSSLTASSLLQNRTLWTLLHYDEMINTCSK